MSGVHGVEREDQSRGRMSLTLLTAHTDGAVQTPNPPIQNTHTLSSHIHTHRADVCWGRFEVFLLSTSIWIFSFCSSPIFVLFR